jgi:DNA-binding CsgD family transcriptional regulator
MQTASADAGRSAGAGRRAGAGRSAAAAVRVRALADLAIEMIEAGDIELALRLLADAVRAGPGGHEPAPADDTRATPGEGGLTALPRRLTQQAWDAIVLAGGEDEPGRQPLGPAAAMIGQAMIAGMRGDEALAERLARQAEAMVLPARIGAALCGIQFVRGVTAIGAGRYDEAFDQLGRMFDRADPAYQAVQSTWALGDLAESAARTGRTDEARKIVDRFRPAPGDRVTPWTRVALLYAAPLLAGCDDAEREFRRALEADLARWPFYRARLLLEYGSWLRRRRRIAEARAPLRHAHQVCEAHGLRPWAERARQELRATGECRTALRAEAPAPLSPQELQIARLAATGLSNRQIGQRLYLSHRTIGSHLYRIFPKLGISSRAQLGSALTVLPPSAG